MIWSSWSDFWNMGGAAYFVWGSYGVTALLVILELFLLRSYRRSSTRRLQRLQRAASSRNLPEAQT